MPLQRVDDPADSRRCKSPTPTGQCWNVAEEGSDHCLAHAPRPTISPTKRIYLLQRADEQKRLAELADHDEVKSLREEIALTRMMIEMWQNEMKTDTDRMLKWPACERAIQTVHRLVKDCFVIEQNLGSLMSTKTAMRLANTIVQIVIDRLEGIDDYELIVDDIIQRVTAVVTSARNEEIVRTVTLLPAPSNLRDLL